MVITVSVTFLILTAPGAVNMALVPNIKLQDDLVFNVIRNFTQYLNHSVNGVLYYIVGSRFRKELLNLCCGKKRPNDTSASHSVNTDVSVSGSRI